MLTRWLQERLITDAVSADRGKDKQHLTDQSKLHDIVLIKKINETQMNSALELNWASAWSNNMGLPNENHRLVVPSEFGCRPIIKLPATVSYQAMYVCAHEG